jgi:hypothetical protein
LLQDFLSESGPSEAKMKSETDYEMTEADKEEVHHEGDVEEEKEDVEVEANEEESVKGTTANPLLDLPTLFQFLVASTLILIFVL